MKQRPDPDELKLRAPYRDHGVGGMSPPSSTGEPKSEEHPSKRPSFQSAVAHFFGAAERMTKRITAVLAVVSAALTFGSVAFAYWVSGWAKGFVQDTMARANADIRAVRYSAESIERSVQELQRRDQLQDATDYEHTRQIANIEGALMSKRPYRGGSP